MRHSLRATYGVVGSMIVNMQSKNSQHLTTCDCKRHMSCTHPSNHRHKLGPTLRHQTSPDRPNIWRRLAAARGMVTTSNFSVAGSKRRVALLLHSDAQTMSLYVGIHGIHGVDVGLAARRLEGAPAVGACAQCRVVH